MANASGPPQRPEDQSPWSRPSVLLSGAFILALILLGIVIAVTGGGGQHHASKVANTPTAARTTPTSTANPNACTLPSGSQSIPSNAAPQATFGTVGAMQVPQSSSVYGPQHVNGVYATCFAHNPAGALLAAINFYAESTTGTPASTVMERYAVGAPANLGNNSGIDNSGPVQLAGYKYDSYTPTKAEVSIVFQGAQGRLVAIVTPMAWAGGDWKYVFPAGGQPSLQTIPDLTGYVSWSDFG